MSTGKPATKSARTGPPISDAMNPVRLINFIGTKQVQNVGLRSALEATIRVAPHMSDKRFMSLFDRTLENVKTVEKREALSEVLFVARRLLSDQEYRGSATKLFRRIVSQRPAYLKAQTAFREEHRVKPLDLIVISPCMRCNLRCYGCYAGQYSRADDLPTDVLERVVAEAKGMGVHLAVVSGGEPFMSEDILRVWQNNPDLSFIVYTPALNPQPPPPLHDHRQSGCPQGRGR